MQFFQMLRNLKFNLYNRTKKNKSKILNSQDRQIIRLMAWERAKGELKSMLQTYVTEQEKYDKLKQSILEFIEDIEGNGKHE